MEYKFINRYGDEITFIKEGDEIEMKGGDYYRYLFDVDGDGNFVAYNAIDPSGGPFVNVGMDMGYIHEDLKGMVIEKIEKNDKIILKLK
jgi:hypothetical protein